MLLTGPKLPLTVSQLLLMFVFFGNKETVNGNLGLVYGNIGPGNSNLELDLTPKYRI